MTEIEKLCKCRLPCRGCGKPKGECVDDWEETPDDECPLGGDCGGRGYTSEMFFI